MTIDPKGVVGYLAVDVPLDSIRPSEDNPRDAVEVDDDLVELAGTIRRQGLLEPLVVAPRPGEDGHYDLIMGHRRLAALVLNRDEHGGPAVTSPMVREDLADSKLAAEARLIENLHRKDLSVFEEARGYQALIKQHGYSQQQIAEGVGRNQAHISKRLALLNLPEPLQLAVRLGNLGVTDAVEISRIKHKPSVEKLVRLAGANGKGVISPTSIGNALGEAKNEEERVQVRAALKKRKLRVLDGTEPGISSLTDWRWEAQFGLPKPEHLQLGCVGFTVKDYPTFSVASNGTDTDALIGKWTQAYCTAPDTHPNKEALRLAAAAAEQERIAAEQEAEQERRAAARQAEQERLAAELEAAKDDPETQARLQAEREAFEARQAAEDAERQAEQERAAAEAAERKRLDGVARGRFEEQQRQLEEFRQARQEAEQRRLGFAQTMLAGKLPAGTVDFILRVQLMSFYLDDGLWLTSLIDGARPSLLPANAPDPDATLSVGKGDELGRLALAAVVEACDDACGNQIPNPVVGVSRDADDRAQGAFARTYLQFLVDAGYEPTPLERTALAAWPTFDAWVSDPEGALEYDDEEEGGADLEGEDPADSQPVTDVVTDLSAFDGGEPQDGGEEGAQEPQDGPQAGAEPTGEVQDGEAQDGPQGPTALPKELSAEDVEDSADLDDDRVLRPEDREDAAAADAEDPIYAIA